MEQSQFPTDNDLIVIQEALAAGEGRDVTPEEVEPLVRWVGRALTDGALAQLILDGRVIARRGADGGFLFRRAPAGEAPTL